MCFVVGITTPFWWAFRQKNTNVYLFMRKRVALDSIPLRSLWIYASCKESGEPTTIRVSSEALQRRKDRCMLITLCRIASTLEGIRYIFQILVSCGQKLTLVSLLPTNETRGEEGCRTKSSSSQEYLMYNVP